MRCNILRASDDYVLNVRDTDEIAEEYGMNDSAAYAMECELKKAGRFWLGADTYAAPVR
jgi:hypothetical protein